MNTKISPQTKWLLLYLKSKHDEGVFDSMLRRPLGVAAINPLPVPNTLKGGKVGMIHMRGLLKRGWAEERSNGIYYLTLAGLVAAIDLAKDGVLRVRIN